MIGTLHARLDGRLVTPEEADEADPRRRRPIPRGLLETVLVRRDRPCLASAHARRLARSCAALGLGTLDPAAVERVLFKAARQAAGGRARLRVLRWEEGGAARELISLDPEPPPPAEIVVGISPERRPRGLDARRHKRIDAADLDRARLGAADAGVFDLLVLGDEGRVLEGAKTNVFWRTGAVFSTPAAHLPLLPGVRREWFIFLARRAGFEVREVESEITELLSAEEVVVTNAILGVRRHVRLAT